MPTGPSASQSSLASTNSCRTGQVTSTMWDLVRYDSVRQRVWIMGQRVHHGLLGASLAAYGLARSATVLTVIGIALMVHDARDAPWLRDLP